MVLKMKAYYIINFDTIKFDLVVGSSNSTEDELDLAQLLEIDVEFFDKEDDDCLESLAKKVGKTMMEPVSFRSFGQQSCLGLRLLMEFFLWLSMCHV